MNHSPITAYGTTFDTTAGVSLRSHGGHIHPPNLYLTAGDFTATINWDDGNPRAGTIVGRRRWGLEYTGSETYVKAGEYPNVTVNISDQGGSTAEADSTADVAPASTTTTLSSSDSKAV